MLHATGRRAIAAGLSIAVFLFSQGAAAKDCPRDFLEAFGKSTATHYCTCDASRLTEGSVWGTNVYTSDSAICQAAVHAGVLGQEGGDVNVRGFEGQETYEATERYGVKSRSYTAYPWSFYFPASRHTSIGDLPVDTPLAQLPPAGDGAAGGAEASQVVQTEAMATKPQRTPEADASGAPNYDCELLVAERAELELLYLKTAIALSEAYELLAVEQEILDASRFQLFQALDIISDAFSRDMPMNADSTPIPLFDEGQMIATGQRLYTYQGALQRVQQIAADIKTFHERLKLQQRGLELATATLDDECDPAVQAAVAAVDPAAPDSDSPAAPVPQDQTADTSEDGGGPSYSQVSGQVIFAENWRQAHGVTLERCKAICDSSTACGSFEYHAARRYCAANQVTDTAPTPAEGYVLFFKSDGEGAETSQGEATSEAMAASPTGGQDEPICRDLVEGDPYHETYSHCCDIDEGSSQWTHRTTGDVGVWNRNCRGWGLE